MTFSFMNFSIMISGIKNSKQNFQHQASTLEDHDLKVHGLKVHGLKIHCLKVHSLKVHLGLKYPTTIKKYADALWEVVKEGDINVNLRSNLVEVKPDTKEAVFQNLDKVF